MQIIFKVQKNAHKCSKQNSIVFLYSIFYALNIICILYFFFCFNNSYFAQKHLNRNMLILLIIFLIIMQINLLLDDYCDFLMRTVYGFIHTVAKMVTINQTFKNRIYGYSFNVLVLKRLLQCALSIEPPIEIIANSLQISNIEFTFTKYSKPAVFIFCSNDTLVTLLKYV